MGLGLSLQHSKLKEYKLQPTWSPLRSLKGMVKVVVVIPKHNRLIMNLVEPFGSSRNGTFFAIIRAGIENMKNNTCRVNMKSNTSKPYFLPYRNITYEAV